MIVKKKLSKAFKRKWVTALRSGKFKQGIGNLLNDKEQYCCLGVAGDLCKIRKSRMVNNSFLYDKKIPIAIRGKAYVAEFLAYKNDGSLIKRRWSFNKIANWIEKFL